MGALQNPGFRLQRDAGPHSAVVFREDFPVHQSWAVGLRGGVCLHRPLLPAVSRVSDRAQECAQAAHHYSHACFQICGGYVSQAFRRTPVVRELVECFADVFVGVICAGITEIRTSHELGD